MGHKMELVMHKKEGLENDLNLKFIHEQKRKFDSELEMNYFSMKEALEIYHAIVKFVPLTTLYYLNQFLNMEVLKLNKKQKS